MIMLEKLKEKILSGGNAEADDIPVLFSAQTDELCAAADEIREKLCGNDFDLCAILNGKSGKCGEDCKFCAQSSKYSGRPQEYPLMSESEIVRAAEKSALSGVPRFSVVTSGKRLNGKEVDSLCESIRAVKEKVGVSVCVSVGLLGKEAYKKLRDAGAERAHCNLETSERYFPHICSTHTYADKIAALENAKAAGLGICSGGIMGLGETRSDRAAMAFALRNLGVESVPINFLNPICGTPFENNVLLSDDEKRRTVALFRFILPTAYVRLAGGRGLIADKGEACFRSGANAAITGDMLTTAGISAQTDIAMLKDSGFNPKVFNGAARK